MYCGLSSEDLLNPKNNQTRSHNYCFHGFGEPVGMSLCSLGYCFHQKTFSKQLNVIHSVCFLQVWVAKGFELVCLPSSFLAGKGKGNKMESCSLSHRSLSWNPSSLFCKGQKVPPDSYGGGRDIDFTRLHNTKLRDALCCQAYCYLIHS